MLKIAVTKSLKKILLIHIVCWALFITYELTMVYIAIGTLEKPYVYIFFYAINISFFYGSAALLSYIFKIQKHRYLKGVAGYLALLILYLLIKSTADYLINSSPTSPSISIIIIESFFQRNIMRAILFTILSMFYWSAGRIAFFKRQTLEAEKLQLNIEKEKAILEVQLTKSQNAYLQQQINPHMLFNALNFAYNSTQKYSDDGAQCIWLLSEIMRFSLEESDPDGKINLDREVEQIENLIAINRYRFAQPLNLNVQREGDFNGHKIIPLILLTLTENVFKHGDLTEAGSPAVLKLTVEENGQLTFYSRNLKKSKNRYPRERKAIGLQNIRLRMDAFYKDSYQLKINEPGDFYELTLTLKL
ncbi:sensor histidine kinase [Pedobacter sp. GSP4]|uniref:sensor histidine kinase n=1 Tax=Pedobacter sp. GSP4 TaxID=3453716 RepID=UPI003EEC49DC